MTDLVQNPANGFAPHLDPRKPIVMFFEILILAGIVPVVALWFAAPWLADSGSLWLAFVPLLLGLRYGLAAGAGAALLLAAAFLVIGYLVPESLIEYPRLQAVGLLLVGTAAGEFRDSWASRIRRLVSESRYHSARLEQFTRSYHLLQASHAKLERQLGSNGTSLRTMLQRLKAQHALVDSSEVGALSSLGKWLLEILAEAGHLHTAAVYAVSERRVLQLPAIATVGEPAALSPFNPLLRETLRTGSVTSVSPDQDSARIDLIAVVPLIDSFGHLHGVVVINEMPFFALRQSTLDLLAVLSGHIGDILTGGTRLIDHEDGGLAFKQHLQRSLSDATRNSMPASVLAFKVSAKGDDQNELLEGICSEGRGLDQTWITHDRHGHSAVVKLLPLSDEAGAQRFLERVNCLAVARLGESSAAGAVSSSRIWSLGGDQTADCILAEICDAFDIEGRGAARGAAPQAISEVAE